MSKIKAFKHFFRAKSLINLCLKTLSLPPLAAEALAKEALIAIALAQTFSKSDYFKKIHKNLIRK